ncbi:alcohol dehydrogenase catalytic domain-containing protein [Actinacidiphila yeochonensis]|uniref:alcohol dehydrogenase catalytic domain-containing protein n=1 Tax=Actinacidiphila yeochonensis TaxID=89050 RepID=UPI00068D7887|nr:alcohol dehydrogenase catalytic domain-containing protein [Actinacidiphila yeochonensis]
MKALVYQGPGEIGWRDVADPEPRDAADAIVRVETAAICGTDLRVRRGEVPEVRPGTVLGHEAVGEVVEVGAAVRGAVPGERVLVSCVSGCGRCAYCRRGVYGQCREGGGRVLGRTADGTQAEYVRVPYADLALHPLPEAVSGRDAVLLADVFPAAYELGVLGGGVRPGDTVAVVGVGPVGLAVVATARLLSPARTVAVDVDTSRLDTAKRLGADAVAGPEEAEALVEDLTGGLGADVVVEAVGAPEAFEQCVRMARPGGTVANIGAHGGPAALHLEEVWSRDLTIRTGLVDTSSIPTLLRMLADGRLPASEFVTHVFAWDAAAEAYGVLERAADTGALKVVLGGPTHDAVGLRSRSDLGADTRQEAAR